MLGLELGTELGDEDGDDDGTVDGSNGTQYVQSSSLSLQTSSGMGSLSSEQLLQHPSQLQEPSPISTLTFTQQPSSPSGQTHEFSPTLIGSICGNSNRRNTIPLPLLLPCVEVVVELADVDEAQEFVPTQLPLPTELNGVS